MWKPIGILVIGAACIVYGVSIWSIPAAWITAGILLITAALQWDIPDGRRLNR